MEEQEDTNSVSLLLTADDEQAETEDDALVAKASTEELHDTEMVSQEYVIDNISMIEKAIDCAVRAAHDNLLQQHLRTSSDDKKDIVPSDYCWTVLCHSFQGF
jgi:hypothetical protein